MQELNLSALRIIDITKTITPPEEPFGPDDISARVISEELIYPLEKYQSAVDDTTYLMLTLKSHLGTHVEVPSHFMENGSKLLDFPLETWMGRMVFFKLDLEPNTLVSQEILKRADNGRLKENDTVLLTTGHTRADRCFLGPEAAEFIVSKKVKLLGFDRSVGFEPPIRETSFKIHDILFGNNIPMLEWVCNLDQLQQDTSLLLALPALKVKGMDASPVRAVVIEGIEIEGNLHS